MCSRTISLGGFLTQGTSARTPRQVFSRRQTAAGIQVTPDSKKTNFSSGNFVKTPSETRLTMALSKPKDCAT